MKVFRGDVVLLDFPFSNAAGSKVRPAVVVQSDTYNRKMDCTIVVLVTKTTHRATNEPTQIYLDAQSAEGKTAGIRFDSAVTCTNLYTVHESFVRHRIGRLPNSLFPQLDGCLKAALGVA